MTFKVGDRVVAEAESTERVARSGTVREVLRDAPAARYRIDWDDGHSTVYTPAAGALHAAPQPRSRHADAELKSAGTSRAGGRVPKTSKSSTSPRERSTRPSVLLTGVSRGKRSRPSDGGRTCTPTSHRHPQLIVANPHGRDAAAAR